jgi:uncharacterized protein YggU (UPF0235/DUF167 family)
MAGPTTRLRLRVSPGSAHSEIVGRRGDSWQVRVGATPELGRANDALLRLLADRLRVPRTRLTLVSGRAARDKLAQREGLDGDEAARRLEGAR